MMAVNETAFLMAYDSLQKIHFELRCGTYNAYKIEKLVHDLALILDQYPILINHQLWANAEDVMILQKLKNPNLGSLAIKVPVNSSGSDILIIDYKQNKTYVRKEKDQVSG